MKKFKAAFFLLLSLLVSLSLPAQDSTAVNKKKLNRLIIGGASIYGVTLVGLNELWYKDFPKEKFHFFDDSKQWKQMDKLGHAYSSYQLTGISYLALKSTNMSNKKAYLWSGFAGLVYMTPIEILDGYSSEYGASASDMVFNLTGTLLFSVQGLVWNEQRIYPKYSFQPSKYAALRPEVLGKNTTEQIVKDYNAHTMWLSIDIYSFLNESSSFPKWLNLSLGYGADDMIYANDRSNINAGYNPIRQYYIGIDFDVTHFHSKSKFINGLLYLVNMIHLPAPTLEIKENGTVKFHAFYF